MLDKIKKLFGKKEPIIIEKPKKIYKKDINEERTNISTNESSSIKEKKDRIPRDDLYRLHYIYISKIIDYEQYETKEIIDWVFPIFKIPNNMTEKELYIFISYLYKLSLISQKHYFWDAINETNRLLEELKFNFQPSDTIEKYIPKELYIVEGNFEEFKNSEYYKNYIDWYNETVTDESLLNLSFENRILINKIDHNLSMYNQSYVNPINKKLARKQTKYDPKKYQKNTVKKTYT